ncbi:MAG: 30S ribosomal protein S3 [Patescibacteria group bacterium]|nr:30S ribosomal protein S3 [Patescibacteria group bacterium]MDE2437813.1 30S ribosomal protein S3 [Patescibacteria group bacterium]
MGHKIHPKSFRLSVQNTWSSKWLTNKKKFPYLLEEDWGIREYLRKRLRQTEVDSVSIERFGNNLKITLRVSKPGIVIGRGGKDIESLKKHIEAILGRISKKYPGQNLSKRVLSINVEEVPKNDVSATVVAQELAAQIEHRSTFRRTMKKGLEHILQNPAIAGAKIRMSGRLDGNEISRAEWLSKGTIPLQTLRANIDYGEATAFCSYGAVGIKVWIYKGEFIPNN